MAPAGSVPHFKQIPAPSAPQGDTEVNGQELGTELYSPMKVKARASSGFYKYKQQRFTSNGPFRPETAWPGSLALLFCIYRLALVHYDLVSRCLHKLPDGKPPRISTGESTGLSCPGRQGGHIPLLISAPHSIFQLQRADPALAQGTDQLTTRSRF